MLEPELGTEAPRPTNDGATDGTAFPTLTSDAVLIRPTATAVLAKSTSSSGGHHNGMDHQTWALVATCTGMLSVALGLWLLTRYLAKRQRQSPGGQACGGVPWKRVIYAMDVSVYIVIWYAISIGMTLFNKWFLRVWTGSGYPFATTMTCLNMALKWVLSRLVNHFSSSKMSVLSTRTTWRLAVPIGLCTALDIMLSNLSFFCISVTFYTIVKSSANVWNLIFSICLGHQRPSYALVVVTMLISSGIALASYGSTQFVLHGFLLVLAASMLGTLRWVLTQSLLSQMEESSNRILAVVYYISPASALGLMPIALLSEGTSIVQSKFVLDSQLLLLSMVLMLISGSLAFVLIFVEILLVKKTSALSLGIAGSLKDVTQVLLAVMIFGEVLSPVNVMGLVVATCGMMLYTYLKNSKAEQEWTYAQLATSENAGDDLDKTVRHHDVTPVIRMTSSTSSSSVELVRRESKEYYDDHHKSSLHAIHVQR